MYPNKQKHPFTQIFMISSFAMDVAQFDYKSPMSLFLAGKGRNIFDYIPQIWSSRPSKKLSGSLRSIEEMVGLFLFAAVTAHVLCSLHSPVLEV